MSSIRRLALCDSNFIPSGRNCWLVNFSQTFEQNGQIEHLFERRHEYSELKVNRVGQPVKAQ